MISKTIKYTDYNDVEREETFYFNLTKAEVVEMELGITGGLGEKLQRIVLAKDVPEIIKAFKELLLKSYGVKSDDGRRFIKSEQLSAEFSQTEAYSILYMELSMDAEAASAFINGIMPKDMINIANNSPRPVINLNTNNSVINQSHTAYADAQISSLTTHTGAQVSPPQDYSM